MSTKRGKKKKDVEPDNSVVLSPTSATPVFNIHIHVHSENGIDSHSANTKIKPVVHLHLDSLAKSLLPALAAAESSSPPKTPKKRERKKKESPSTATNNSKSRAKKRKVSVCNETPEHSIENFNPIYTSSQKKSNRTDDIVKSSRKCDSGIETGNIHTDNVVDTSDNIPPDIDGSVTNISHGDNPEAKDSESDSSRSNTSLRCRNDVTRRFSVQNRRRENVEKPKLTTSKVVQEKNVPLKEAVVVLRDIAHNKKLMSSLTRGGLRKVSAFMNAIEDGSESSNCEDSGHIEKPVTERTEKSLLGERDNEERSAVEPERPFGDVNEDSLNKSNSIVEQNDVSEDVDLSSAPVDDEEYCSRSDTCDSEPEAEETNNGCSEVRELEAPKSAQHEVENVQNGDASSMNTSSKDNDPGARVPSPEKLKSNEKVLGDDVTSILDALNFTEIREMFDAIEMESDFRVNCKSSKTNSKDSSDDVIWPIESGDSRGKRANVCCEHEMKNLEEGRRVEKELTLRSSNEKPAENFSPLLEPKEEKSPTAAKSAEKTSSPLTLSKTSNKKSFSNVIYLSDSDDEDILEPATRRLIHRVLKRTLRSPSSSEDEEERAKNVTTCRKSFFSADEINAQFENGVTSAKTSAVKPQSENLKTQCQSATPENSTDEVETEKTLSIEKVTTEPKENNPKKNVTENEDSPPISEPERKNEENVVQKETTTETNQIPEKNSTICQTEEEKIQGNDATPMVNVENTRQLENGEEEDISPESPVVTESPCLFSSDEDDVRRMMEGMKSTDERSRRSTVSPGNSSESEAAAEKEEEGEISGKEKEDSTNGNHAMLPQTNETEEDEGEHNKEAEVNGKNKKMDEEDVEDPEEVEIGDKEWKTLNCDDRKKSASEEEKDKQNGFETHVVVENDGPADLGAIDEQDNGESSKDETALDSEERVERVRREEKMPPKKCVKELFATPEELKPKASVTPVKKSPNENGVPQESAAVDEMEGFETCTEDFLNDVSSNCSNESLGRLIIALESDAESCVSSKERNKGGKSAKTKKVSDTCTPPSDTCTPPSDTCSDRELSVRILSNGKLKISKRERKKQTDTKPKKPTDDDMGQKSRKIKKPKKSSGTKRKAQDGWTNSSQAKKLKVSKNKGKSIEFKKKETPVKKEFGGDEYIPIDVAGPTKFAVANLQKLKSYVGHDAATFKEAMLFGDRVRRFASPKDHNVGKLKQKAGDSCTR